MEPPAIDRREWTWVVIVSVCILVLSSIPYIIGYLAQSPDQQFGGTFLNWLDYNTYLAKMWQGYRGSWGYEITFTTEPHTPAFLIYIFYILLGHLARITRLSLPAMYQIARVVFGFLMLVSCYYFQAHFLERIRTRRVAFLLSTATLGLGWLTQMINPFPAGEFGPMDFWFTDAYLYLSLFTSPHFSASTAISLIIFALLLLQPAKPLSRKTFFAAFLSIALGLIHPYMLLLVDLLVFAYWVVDLVRKRSVMWPRTLALVVVALSQVPLIAYYYWLFYVKPVFSDWMGQTVCLSPPPHIYLLGYGVLLVLAIAGAVAWAKERKEALVFPLLWISLVAVLVYFPSGLQRRFVEGVQVPLGLLAAVGLTKVIFSTRAKPSRKRRRLFMQALVIAFAAIGTLFLTAGLSLAAVNHVGNLYWPINLIDAADWLQENSEAEKTILAGSDTGNFLAGRIGHRVVIGHEMETLYFTPKLKTVTRFFTANTPDRERVALLREWGVSYVVHGPEEQHLGDFDPALADWADLVFETEGVRLYQVRLGENE